MNVARRKALWAVISQFETVQEELEVLKDEEQDYLDNIPENLQGSERYEVAENAVGFLEDALSSLEDVFSAIELAITGG